MGEVYEDLFLFDGGLGKENCFYLSLWLFISCLQFREWFNMYVFMGRINWMQWDVNNNKDKI